MRVVAGIVERLSGTRDDARYSMGEADKLFRPMPLRPGRPQRQTTVDVDNDDNDSDNARHMGIHSQGELRGMSRTSSILSLSGLAERSSALFGIFEQGGGYETEPATPEAGAGARRYELRSTARVDNAAEARMREDALAQARMSAVLQDLLRTSIILTTSYLFILLFNRLPSTNKFCAITSAENISPVLYCLAATATAIIFSAASRAVRHHPAPAAADGDRDDAEDAAVSEKAQKAASSGETNLIIRWFAGFLGLAYAGTKLDYSNAWQFNGCVAAVAAGCLLVVDRTVRGFVISLGLAAVGTATYATIVQPPLDMLPGVSVLVWLNVAVYGCLGKVMGLLRRRDGVRDRR